MGEALQNFFWQDLDEFLGWRGSQLMGNRLPQGYRQILSKVADATETFLAKLPANLRDDFMELDALHGELVAEETKLFYLLGFSDGLQFATRANPFG